MNFDESVEYLLSLGNEVTAMKLGLENISKLLAALGNPQNNYLKIQIAGTNGKGSTVAFLESICFQAGIKVGATTSPHLTSITERIRIDGREISEDDFALLATKVRETSENLFAAGKLETVPTYFEQVTATALTAFAEAKIELAILETGLGGRYDATTAAKAEIVAITPIDYDHQNILGTSLKEIAAEKAAIIRSDTKVVIAPQKREAEQVILGRCREVEVEPIRATEKISVVKRNEENGLAFLTATFTTENAIYPDVIFGLGAMSGRHQITNASTAISLAEILGEFNFNITEKNILSGLENTKHKGRLEFYKEILFDGAHNVSGARSLREYLDEFIHQPITMVFGAMRDKDLSEISQILFPKATFLIFTKAENPRSMETSELMKFVPKDFNRKNIHRRETVKEALELAHYYTVNGIACVTGSLYLVGEAQMILREKD